MMWRRVFPFLCLIAFTIAASRIKREEPIAEGSGEPMAEGSGAIGAIEGQSPAEETQDSVKEKSNADEDTLTGTEATNAEHSDAKREDASQSQFSSAAQQGVNSAQSLFAYSFISIIIAIFIF
ncbi:unnamed protein product, partial [Mesorhabditis belari]|uniref:Uncharacterized protein n=1 Tax=Mesorhabditis belari TaxID=2138241 RepID=A0AAF3FQ89_9BILA